MLFLLAAVILYKIPIFYSPFYGLEYEDSYIFNVVAHQISLGFLPKSIFTEGVICGSLINPILTGEFSGHYVLFSVLGSWIIKIFGYTPNCISYANSFISLLTLLVLIDFGERVQINSQFWWILPSIFLISPIINVFNSSQLSETFSGFVILTCLYSYLRFTQDKKATIPLLLLIVSSIIVILTKRENYVIIVYFFTAALIPFIKGRKTLINKKILVLIFITLGYTLIHTFFGKLIHSVVTESNEISNSAFSISYLLKILPVFIKSIVSFKYFTLAGFLFITTILSVIIFSKHFSETSFPILVLVIGYVLLYSLHFRSYYFIHYNDLSIFDTFRYWTNIFPILSLFVGIILTHLMRMSNHIKVITNVLIIIVLGISAIYTQITGSSFQKEESQVRFEDAQEYLITIDHQENDILITSNPFIYQILAPEDFKILDLVELQHCLETLSSFENIYFLEDYFNSSNEFKRRYSDSIEILERLNKTHVTEFKSGAILYQIGLNENSPIIEGQITSKWLLEN